MKQFTIITVLAMTILSGCMEQSPNKQQFGTVLGGIAGGVLGNQVGGGKGKVIATIGGTLLGAFVGSSVGQSLDKADAMYAGQAQSAAYNAPMNSTIAWNNPENAHSGTVTPVRDGYHSNGSYCREFQQTVTIDGRTEQAYGTACQQPDGTWSLSN